MNDDIKREELACEHGVALPDEILATSLLVAAESEYIGQIIVTDDIKTEAETAITALKQLGVKRVAMLSGDRRENAERVGRDLGITEIHSELLPEEKYKKLGEMIASSTATVYVGDGINDAPAITSADVGIAKMNIAFALTVKGAILLISALGFANRWLAVFADVGVAVIAILNSLRTLKV